jgi:hypothetical protein
MGNMHLKLGVLILVAAGIANGQDKHNFYVTVHTRPNPNLPPIPPFFSSSRRDVILGFEDGSTNGDGWLLNTLDAKLALSTSPDLPPRQFHAVKGLVDPCRLFLQLVSSEAFLLESALWTPSSVNVVVYTIGDTPEVKYRRVFENIPEVTPFQTVEVNICDQPAGTA